MRFSEESSPVLRNTPVCWDVTVMRILAVVLTVCTYFWPCVIIYLLAWMIIPVARTPREILEMQGQPVRSTTSVRP